MSEAANEPFEVKRKILVADDAPIFREIASVFLGRLANLVTANDGDQAYELALRERPDVVVSDLTMQQMHGDELCRRIRSHPDLRRLHVIILTSGRDAAEHERAVRAGADDVIEKPLDRSSLVQAVTRLLRLTVRGLERVDFDTDVHLQGEACEFWGRARNISRGGMFVECESLPEPDTEVSVEFTRPGSPAVVTPTARVVWRRPPQQDQPPGFGLQFLKLDRELSRWLEDFVYERGQGPGALDISSST